MNKNEKFWKKTPEQRNLYIIFSLPFLFCYFFPSYLFSLFLYFFDALHVYKDNDIIIFTGHKMCKDPKTNP